LRRRVASCTLRRVPLVHACKTEGCNVLTMGDFCLECEAKRVTDLDVELHSAAGNVAATALAPDGQDAEPRSRR
jgi:hypothetical protein